MFKFELLPDKVIKYLDEDFETVNLEKFYRIDDPYDKPNAVVLVVPDNIKFPCNVKVIGGVDLFEYSLSKREEIKLYNLHIGTEYVVTYTDGISTEIEKFVTSSRLPRMMRVEGIYNVRDIGGYKAGNKKIVFDKLFRGSEMNLILDHGVQITKSGEKTMREDMKIKMDIDLRNAEETATIDHSPLGRDIQYYNLRVLGYMDMFKDEFNSALNKIFTLLSIEENYPIYLHCWAGADRTGTVITVLKAFLGVSYEDIVRDHEISTFSIFGLRGRCNKEFTYPEVFEHLKNTYKADTLQLSATKYLKEKVGLSDDTLNNIKKILLTNED